MYQILLPFICAVLLAVVAGQSHHRCPAGCKCDFEGLFKRVRCEISSSAANINFNDVDADVHFLEVLPLTRGARDAFGPSLPDAFQDFPNLERLVIRNNGIQRIPAATARQVARLNTLDLSGNEIVSLDDLQLDSLAGLDSLQLSSNAIRTIRPESLRSLKGLRALGLGANQIDRLPAGLFQNQQYLEYLVLANNKIQDLPSGLFASSSRLRSLDLRGNQLQSSPQDVERLFGLESLYLADNKISSIPKELVQAWRHSEVLREISLDGNPLQCDGSLVDLTSWAKSPDGFKKLCNAPSSASNRCPTCSGPGTLQGQTLDNLKERDMQAMSDRSGSEKNSRPTSSNSRPNDNRDQDFMSFEVMDQARAPSGFNPRRDTQPTRSGGGPSDQTAQKFRKYMPGAGVRCGSKKCFYFSAKGTKEWDTAEFTCQNIGFDLVEIGSASEQRELMDLLIASVKEDSQRSSPSRGWWIGIKYDPKRATAFAASTGRSLTYTNWAHDRPNNFGSKESCVELWDTGDWNDGTCALRIENQFICESSLSIGQSLSSGQSSSTRFTDTDSGIKRVSGSSFINRAPSSNERLGAVHR